MLYLTPRKIEPPKIVQRILVLSCLVLVVGVLSILIGTLGFGVFTSAQVIDASVNGTGKAVKVEIKYVVDSDTFYSEKYIDLCPECAVKTYQGRRLVIQYWPQFPEYCTILQGCDGKNMQLGKVYYDVECRRFWESL